MNTGPLGMVAPLWKLHNYIFGGGPKRKKTETGGDKVPDVVLPEPPKPRHDPEMDNYIWL